MKRAVARRAGLGGHIGGFTLLEVLVVMALLSLLMLAMGSALRTTAQTEERVDQKLLRTDETRMADDFLRDVLGRVSAQKRLGPASTGTSLYAFSAQPQSLTWIGVMPARFGAGGRYHFRLALEGQALVLSYLPWDSTKEADWGRAQAYVLLKDVVAMQMRYQDANKEPPVWSDRWESLTRFPQRVRVAVTTTTGPRPDLVVAMRLLPGGDPDASGVFSVGGGVR